MECVQTAAFATHVKRVTTWTDTKTVSRTSVNTILITRTRVGGTAILSCC